MENPNLQAKGEWLHIGCDGVSIWAIDSQHPPWGEIDVALSDLLKKNPQAFGFRVHFQGPELLVFQQTAQQTDWGKAVREKLPPEKTLADYSLAFNGQFIALLPHSVLKPFYQQAQERDLACEILALPAPFDGPQVLKQQRESWYLEKTGGQLLRLLPLPEDAEVVRHLVEPGQLAQADFGQKSWPHALFKWCDPEAAQRQIRRKNRRFLAAASLVMALIFLAVPLGLYWTENYWEQQLLFQSAGEAAVAAQVKERGQLLDQLREMVARLESKGSQLKGRAGLAHHLAAIINQCPESIQLENLTYQGELGGRVQYALSGFSQTPGPPVELTGELASLFSKGRPTLEYLDKQAVSDKSSAGFPYRFAIKLEVAP